MLRIMGQKELEASVVLIMEGILDEGIAFSRSP